MPKIDFKHYSDEPIENIASLDLGSNNCRLLVARPCMQHGFRVLDSFSDITRLGLGVSKTGLISEEAQKKTLIALEQCLEKLIDWRVTHFRGVATQACRVAENGIDFLNKVRVRTGLNIKLISPEQEAKLTALSCLSILRSKRAHYGMIFDIGGGSTEIILIKKRGEALVDVVESISIPIGVINLAEDYFGDVLSGSPEGYKKAFEVFWSHLNNISFKQKIDDLRASGDLVIIGNSGTITTVAALSKNLDFYDRRVIDAQSFQSKDILDTIDYLQSLNINQRANLSLIGPKRADLIVSGTCIVQALLQFWDVDTVLVADRGLREGLINTILYPDLRDHLEISL